jgi:hypothetical protein
MLHKMRKNYKVYAQEKLNRRETKLKNMNEGKASLSPFRYKIQFCFSS